MRNTGIFLASARRRHCSAEQSKIFATALNPIVGSKPPSDGSDVSRPMPETSDRCECWLVDMTYSTAAAEGVGSSSCQVSIPLSLFGQKHSHPLANVPNASSKLLSPWKALRLQSVHACAPFLALGNGFREIGSDRLQFGWLYVIHHPGVDLVVVFHLVHLWL